MKIGRREREEMLLLAASESMRRDHAHLAEVRKSSPCLDADAFIEFLAFYNSFLNHQVKQARPIADAHMLL